MIEEKVFCDMAHACIQDWEPVKLWYASDFILRAPTTFRISNAFISILEAIFAAAAKSFRFLKEQLIASMQRSEWQHIKMH